MSELNSSPQPPTAARKPVERTHHGDTFVDDYEWLRDKADDEVLGYLRAENAYTEARTEHLESLREAIFQEISDRTLQTDLSVPTRRGEYWYYARTVEGQQYGIHCRVKVNGDQPPATDGEIAGEEVLLDGNLVAGDSEFFSLGTVDVSPDGRLLAYSVDLKGDERFTLRIKDLSTGELLPDELPEVHYGSAWSADGSTIFYTKVDDAWRPFQVWRHQLGAAEDVLVKEETDERFWVGVDLTRNEQAILIALGSKLTSEVWLLDANDPAGEPVVVAPRREGVEYDVEHAGDQLLITHNADAANFSLATASLAAPGEWTTLIQGDETSRLLGADAFADHVILYRRRDALTELAIMRRTGDGFGAPETLQFDEPIYTVSPGRNDEWHDTRYRFGYTSLVTPSTTYDVDVATGERRLLKQQPVLGGVDLGAYTQYREWATAPDGTQVPISLVARKDVAKDGNAPVVLYGYGSYESSMDPWFSIARLSLLDRGVVFAIAHVRGGGELGRHWYDNGKTLTKRNTFTDFIAAAEHLVGSGWSRPERIVAQGGSAGGLLMGAVANLAPQAFGGIVAEVPFVDALTTILDPSLPLTVIEWEEWGNPLEDPEVYAYMKSYSPYENVTAQQYPRILAITSLNDTRVFFVEPAKWVAKLRATASGDVDVLLKTEMEAGHGGRSGRYDAWREIAFSLAWELDTLGLA
ncbi:S9 family peptidase [Kribbella sandramycini]|uniref:Oligopeptidase B n=1 Tax=Kribbella sandramycini TaxID=60450 RepID=A0A7Y4KY27_9ACTN|nr:S9 family peptidase [Kribbella sandramycini]MBB6569399.1 oligopeptidase B [Kribbella sandramycini]NOL40764.1 S9 family peptidase [Kribbella sandramycini]